MKKTPVARFINRNKVEFVRRTLKKEHWWEGDFNRVRGFILASGGVDSVVLTHFLANKGSLHEILHVDSGQAAFKRQKAILQYHADELGLKYTTLKVQIPSYAQKDQIAKPGFVPPSHGDDINYFYEIGGEQKTKAKEEENLKFTKDEFAWINGRNALWFIHAGTYAAEHCEGYEGARVFAGFQFDRPFWKKIDKINSDTSPWFVGAMQEVYMQSFVLKPVDLVVPMLDEHMDKDEIIMVGKKLEVNLDETYSCEFYPPCGTCFQCKIVQKYGITQRG